MEMEEKYRVCVDGLKGFAASISATDFVIGLSGGLDSTVVAALAVDAFGAQHVNGVLMPGPYSSDHSLTDAQDLAQRLGVSARTVSIAAPFAALKEAFQQGWGEELVGLAAENSQARLRMTVLMALSNQYGWMVINTGNKSEAMMGYSTLYGDTAGAYAPIGGLYKTDVFALAEWLNQRAREAGQVEPIPQHVIDKPPSAELSEGQQDEKSLGVCYAQLDQILVGLVDRGLSVEEVVAQGFDEALVERINRTMRGYAYKRALEPPFPAIEY